jgi:hypothetical protein
MILAAGKGYSAYISEVTAALVGNGLEPCTLEQHKTKLLEFETDANRDTDGRGERRRAGSTMYSFA